MGYPRESRTNSPASVFRHSPKRRGLSKRSNSPTLPATEGKYSRPFSKQSTASDFSNFFHLINNERFMRGIPQLTLSQELAQMARDHAQFMADQETVRHSSEIVVRLSSTSNKAGQNVGRASSCEKAHLVMMSAGGNGSRITDWGYSQVGVGTARSPDGVVYVCELFTA